MRRGEIWWADLGAHRPQEQTGRRPVIIWQSDTLSRALQSVLVVPLTTNLDRAKLAPLMKQRKNRPLLLIDIAVPRDIEPEVNFLENVYLYNIDDLQAIADDYLKQRKEEIARCKAIIREKAQALLGGHRPPPEPAGSSEPAFSHE